MIIHQFWTKMPIQFQSLNNLPTFAQFPNNELNVTPILDQSATPMQIPDQSINPYPIHQSLLIAQIQRQTIMSMSIHNPCTNLKIYCQSTNPLRILWFNANLDQSTRPLYTTVPILEQSLYQMAIQYQFVNPWPIHQPNANLLDRYPKL